ncbi:glycosyltransferase [Bdellovibrio sp. HCB337]|uniref:CgeB family protein n=1 Tax=Bdellovibrio sp. HCB337 TaxID=3394358 RepID=UPI0039A571DD
MKILLVCMQHDYGQASRGHSYEYTNYYHSLVQMGHEVILFDYMAEMQQQGKAQMNANLLRRAEELKPAVAIFHLYTDQFEVSTIQALRAHTKTLSIFHDDTWRKEYAYFWAPHFDFFTTPDYFSVRRYAAHGLKHVLLFSYGCNEKMYYRMNEPKIHDVSFVGRWHPYRQWLVDKLAKAGVKVVAKGPGWSGGMVSHDEMVKLFNQSRINLNISNSASWDARYLCSSWRALVDRIRSKKSVEQLKARHFEINGCGGFQLSYYVEGLERQYAISDEMDVYGSIDELVDKVKFYLENADQREAMANAGYQRTLKDHSFSARFTKLFQEMGLKNG